MKYMKIYKVISNYPQLQVHDCSNWNVTYSKLAANARIILTHPLSIILDISKTDLQIWVDHQHGRYSICTHNVHSCERYHNFQHYTFRNQRDTAEKLEKILSQEKEQSNAEI